MAKTELELIDFYFGICFQIYCCVIFNVFLENKVWERVEEVKGIADEMVKEMSESIYFSSASDPEPVNITEQPKP